MFLRKVKNGIRKMAKMFSARAFSGFSGRVYPSPAIKNENRGVKRIFPLWSQSVKKNVATSKSPSAISVLSEVKNEILSPTLSGFKIFFSRKFIKHNIHVIKTFSVVKDNYRPFSKVINGKRCHSDKTVKNLKNKLKFLN